MFKKFLFSVLVDRHFGRKKLPVSLENTWFFQLLSSNWFVLVKKRIWAQFLIEDMKYGFFFQIWAKSITSFLDAEFYVSSEILWEENPKIFSRIKGKMFFAGVLKLYIFRARLRISGWFFSRNVFRQKYCNFETKIFGCC